jgi:HEPN domain-containing protein
MSEKHDEWLKQAAYDMDTADAMFTSGRYLYVVFMCHLSIEKSLKGLHSKELAEVPPKTHNLIYLLKKICLCSGSAENVYPKRQKARRISGIYLHSPYAFEDP